MIKKKTGIKLMMIIFLVLMVGDIISTYCVSGDLLKHLEINWIYPNLWLIILINFLLMGFLYFLYCRSKTPNSHFIFLNTIVTVCVLRVIVIWNNIQVAMDPPTIQQAMQVTQAVKTATIVKLGIMGFIPYFIGYLTFIIFTLDHKIEMKELKE